jgi:regulator of cell morphogenesis and NO signaling
MTFSSTMKVRDVALEFPHATRVLERLNIDYCCGGDRPLREACSLAGVEVERLEQMLSEALQSESGEDSAFDFINLSLTELINHILGKHHVYTKNEMTRLTALIEKVISAHGANHPELKQLGGLFRRLCADLEPHMFKEEQILFPYIVEMEKAVLNHRPKPPSCFGMVSNPIRMMMTEHDTAGDLLRELRLVSSDYAVPADGCVSYQILYQALAAFEQDLHQHIHLENNILFPRAAEMEGDA